jgi:metallo-beta-lactamase family protein
MFCQVLADEKNWAPFTYDPSTIDILFITHSHIDHIGRIPKLIFDGFKGRIISTDATRDLSVPMLLDTVMILGKQKEHDLYKFYTEDIAKKAFSLWEGFAYHEKLSIDDMQITFRDSGHILGSSMIEFMRNDKKMLFTGDLGNSPSPILRDTEKITDIDYLLMESVYGDRNHEARDQRKL